MNAGKAKPRSDQKANSYQLETERGKGLAIAAIVLSSLSLAFSLIPLLFGFANIFGNFLKK